MSVAVTLRQLRRDVTSHELYEADDLMAVTTAGGVTPMTVAIRDRFWALRDEPSPLTEAIQY
jgi:branched-chain amino acid aminotransferase